MATSLAFTDPRLLSVEEFLRIDFGPGLKAELDNGVIRMMAGGTREHARIQANLMHFLGNALRGFGSRPFGSDMGVRTDDRSLRYPDITIDCGAPGDGPGDQFLSAPRVIVEILSPSTRNSDLWVKKEEYRAVATVDTIVFVDPDAGTTAVHQRVPDGWTEADFAARDVRPSALNLVVPHAEIFARD